MSNINNNNIHNLKLILNKDDYWDFFLNKDSFLPYYSQDKHLYDKCLISYIDIAKDECVDGEWIYGIKKYKWDYANSTNYILHNIGYTGIDNGLIRYRKDRISNKEFVNIFTKSKYKIEKDDLYLKLHQVSGNTLLYEYPSKIDNGLLKLNGGFYQGFFETECDKYKILPSQMNSDWCFEFTLKKEEFEKESNKTLNDKYPENKGIFFYIGTRAENKWKYLYNDEEDECDDLSPDNFVEDAHIDRKDYIIGNFYNPNPDFNGFDRFNTDNYLNYKYFSKTIYDDALDYDDIMLDDYIELEEKPPIIDEEKHSYITLGCCGATPQPNNEKEIEYLGCGCGKHIKTNIKNKTNDNKEVYGGCLTFGDDYIGDYDNLDDGLDYIEPELNITDFIYETNDGYKLNIAHNYYFETENKFLLFDRTKDGFTVNNWVDGSKIRYSGIEHRFKGNLFLLMNRTKTGYTVDNIDELRKKDENTYNVYKDIYNNALAFQITDKGEIGYKYLTIDCKDENKVNIIKGYSKENIIKNNVWNVIQIRIQPYTDTMRIYFYVNGNLAFISKEIMKLNLRPLDEIYEKQEGVPYNISLGGGSQGLAETILPNYMLLPTKVYPIEKNFAGSFIGYIKTFKFYDCQMEYYNIVNNFKFEINGID